MYLRSEKTHKTRRKLQRALKCKKNLNRTLWIQYKSMTVSLRRNYHFRSLKIPKTIKMTIMQKTRNNMWSNSFGFKKQGISSRQITMWNPFVQKIGLTNRISIGSKSTIDYTNRWKDCRWMMLKDFMMRFNKILATNSKWISSLKISIMQTLLSLQVKSWNSQTSMIYFRYPIRKIRSPKNNKSSLI